MKKKKNAKKSINQPHQTKNFESASAVTVTMKKQIRAYLKAFQLDNIRPLIVSAV